MQMALRPEGPHVRTALEPDRLQTFKKTPAIQSILSTASTAPVLGETKNSASARAVRNRTRVTSPPTGPQNSATPRRQQCAGVTKAGKRCTRQVKLGTSSTRFDSDDESANEVFCYQHLKELMGPSGFYSRKNGVWIEFTDETKKIKLKVGRAVNLVKRIDQWEKQCGSREQVLRGYYPGAVESDDDGTCSLMKGRLRAGEAGPWCHRMGKKFLHGIVHVTNPCFGEERLIHIELADLAASAIYLVPTWPKVNLQTGDPSPSVKRSSSDSGQRVPCLDCGSHHKEIFEFKRLTGQLKGQEWEKIIQPVIQRWGKFVGQCV
ncbi:hypothetical protein C0995_002732 [Termitomyces sp. Mi166|nr:hypothetical protein C0995_002732 [Termitomyces sp. Mi166\